MNFSQAHFSNLSKYLGISFITGSISHGFFSESRSLLTGGFWATCFAVGMLTEEKSKNTWITIALGALMAVSIGCFTWGLQHFPDSPERSLFIVPTGFILSLFLFAKVHAHTFKQKEYRYIVLSALLVLLVTSSIYFVLEKTNLVEHTPHTTEDPDHPHDD